MTWHNTGLGLQLGTMLKYLGTKQSVISDNLANVNTPNYKAKDVKRPDFATFVQSGKTNNSASLMVTNPMHVLGSDQRSSLFRVEEVEGAEKSLNGNTVSSQKEMISLSETQMDYQAALNLFRKLNDLMKVALGSRQ